MFQCSQFVWHLTKRENLVRHVYRNCNFDTAISPNNSGQRDVYQSIDWGFRSLLQLENQLNGNSQCESDTTCENMNWVIKCCYASAFLFIVVALLLRNHCWILSLLFLYRRMHFVNCFMQQSSEETVVKKTSAFEPSSMSLFFTLVFVLFVYSTMLTLNNARLHSEQ